MPTELRDAQERAIAAAVAKAAPRPFWLDRPGEAPPACPALTGTDRVDLVVVGGGFTGLWAALQAKEEDPDLRVALLEGATVAYGATGRNGGFLSSSLTHGLENGMTRWPDEMPTLERMGRENIEGIAEAIARYGIKANLESPGSISLATREHQVASLAQGRDSADQSEGQWTVLGRDEVRALVNSPTYLGGVMSADSDRLLVDPARLAWGLKRVCLELGVRVHEHSRVVNIAEDGGGVRVTTELGDLLASRVVLATSAFPPLLPVIRRYVIPVYDYVLMTEPLSSEQHRAIGWQGRHGLVDMGNKFHYYRLSDDNRILWGGGPMAYHFGNGIGPHLEHRVFSQTTLAREFYETFPQLEGLGFSHRWGGAIDSSSRFCALFGTALSGRLSYAVGFTGLGVGASRFGARVALDLVEGKVTERTSLRMVQTKPVPFPPEPLRYAGIRITQQALEREDRTGKRGPWLRVLDRFGMGFAS
jgi:glycine/D-amino acid oxidase-like deaminating enzyme